MAQAPTAALIVAAGGGVRAGGAIPKQYRPLGGLPMLVHSLRRFLDHDAIDTVQVVVGEGQDAAYAAAVSAHPRLRPPVQGGPTRQASVRNGLAALAGVNPAAC